VLGTERGADWLARCTLDAFAAELVALFRVDPAALRQLAGSPAADAGWAAGFALYGHYACYSWAWSPYYRGQVIRSALEIRRGSRGHDEALYRERLLGQVIAFTGEPRVVGNTLHVALHGPDEVSPLFLSRHTARAPGSVLCGILSGATAVGPQPLPSPSAASPPASCRRRTASSRSHTTRRSAASATASRPCSAGSRTGAASPHATTAAPPSYSAPLPSPPSSSSGSANQS
jgi:hypothetical protein